MTYVDALLWLLLLLLLPGTPPLQISPPPHTPTAQKAKANVEEFLRDFRTVPVRKGVPGEAKYVSLVAALTEKQVDPKYAVRIQVDLDDVQMFSPELVRDIQQNTRRYSALFSAAIDDMLPPIQRTIGGDDSAYAVLLATRVLNLDRTAVAAGGEGGGGGGGGGGAAGGGGEGGELTAEQIRKFLPPGLLRRFEVRFSCLSSTKPVPLRAVSASDIGRLVAVRCIVLRASDVKPLIEVAAYSWCACGWGSGGICNNDWHTIDTPPPNPKPPAATCAGGRRTRR